MKHDYTREATKTVVGTAGPIADGQSDAGELASHGSNIDRKTDT